ncbi:hypothetical protein [Legionella hackeliae]|uniref:CN hydrolase domain-containing protein n=1 Tax=Legionella hackeliae TaxID=449 RepID=A0A0A8UPH5_LEGHA|nr:hypothetical protein [Legionella hackeliae]KTD06659.1 hypothetical protein Lhac_3182 [Legionella hackeliae]CEK10780.1 protein of unknown function [Legionella hackeliae]STX47518.1 Uncharacterised protein [Legionella hackeliae]
MKTLTIAMWDPGFSIQDLSLSEKIDVLEEKFKAVYQLAMSSLTDETTFLFLCPEFNLLNMKDLSNLSYTKSEFVDIEKRLQKLANDYPQAIIIPGTAYIQKTLDLNDPEKDKKYAATIKKWQLEHLRTLKNFRQEIKDKTIIKSTASIFFESKATKPKRYSKRVEAGEYIDAISSILYPGHSSPFFTHNGIRFGIEICADHEDGVLLSEQKEPIDVHVIIANVMRTMAGKVANKGCQENVIVVNCAGNFSYAPTAAKEVGVWVSGEGDLERLKQDDSSSKDLRIYSDIPVPNQKISLTP